MIGYVFRTYSVAADGIFVATTWAPFGMLG